MSKKRSVPISFKKGSRIKIPKKAVCERNGSSLVFPLSVVNMKCCLAVFIERGSTLQAGATFHVPASHYRSGCILEVGMSSPETGIFRGYVVRS